jgi:hypothetical protein
VKYPVNQEEGEWAGDSGDIAASYEIRRPFSEVQSNGFFLWKKQIHNEIVER